MQITNQPIVNRVDESGLVTFNLEAYFPKDEIMVFDIKPFLFQELILREKDYRKQLSELDCSIYQNKTVCVLCSADAIVPVWAYMLVATYLQPIANKLFWGSEINFIQTEMNNTLSTIDYTQFANQRVVIKGCGDKPVPDGVYMHITSLLLPQAKSIMYGEPCSTVPLYKRK
ncbi:MAG: hypothetical protein RIQ33_2554 [Bacteroidota bacterium]|jgi:hypothetical protein